MKEEPSYERLRAPQDCSDEEADSVGESTQFIPDPEPSSLQETPRQHILLPMVFRGTQAKPPRPWFLSSLVVAVLVLSNVASVFLGAYASRHVASTEDSLDRQCAKHTTQYSPLLLDVDIHYSKVDFNGTFMDEDIYRQPAAPEVDAAWEALGVDYRAGVIPASEGPDSGLTPAHVQRADKYGGGYLVNVEGMHHLHCLNLLRKSLYYNYDYYKDLGQHAFKNDARILQLHVSHCLDTLRQVLMCNVDTAVLGQVWYDRDHPTAFPDFHTTHTCKNYDAVRRWAEALQAPPVDTLPDDYLKPARKEDVWPATP